MKRQYWLVPILLAFLSVGCGNSNDECDYSFDGATYSGTGSFSSQGISYGIRVQMDVYGPGANHPFCTYRPYPATLILPDNTSIDLWGIIDGANREKLVASDSAFADAPDEIQADITFDRETGSFDLTLADNSLPLSGWSLNMKTTLTRE